MKSVGIDLSRHISLQIGVLKLFGIWFYIPYHLKNFRFWINVLTKILLGIAVFVIPTGSQLVYAVRLILSGKAEIQEVAGIINLILTELLVSLRLLDLRFRRDLLMQLSDQLKSEEFKFYLKDQKNILEKAVKFSRRLFWTLFCCSSSDVLVHVLVVPALHNFETLPLKMDLILIDVNTESYFNYVCAYQILYKPMMLATFIALQTLPWAAMSCAISQLDVLIYNFENMKDLVKATVAERRCSENEAFKEIFKRCVLHHNSIIRFVNTIQVAFGGQITATLFLSTGILGTTAVQIFSIESPMKNVTEVIWVMAYLLVFIGNLFIDCYFGNTITIKSMHLSTVVFSCPWIELPTTLKKNIVIFIAKTQRPLVISAAKLIPVSLETFTKIQSFCKRLCLHRKLYLLAKFISCFYDYMYFHENELKINSFTTVFQGILCLYSWNYSFMLTHINKQEERNRKIRTKVMLTSKEISSSIPAIGKMRMLSQVMNWTYKGFAIMNQMKK